MVGNPNQLCLLSPRVSWRGMHQYFVALSIWIWIATNLTCSHVTIMLNIHSICELDMYWQCVYCDRSSNVYTTDISHFILFAVSFKFENTTSLSVIVKSRCFGSFGCTYSPTVPVSTASSHNTHTQRSLSFFFSTEQISGLLSANVNFVKMLSNFQRDYCQHWGFTHFKLQFEQCPSRLLWLFDHNEWPEWPSIKNNGENASRNISTWK